MSDYSSENSSLQENAPSTTTALGNKFSAFAKNKATQWRLSERQAQFNAVVSEKRQDLEKYSQEISKKGKITIEQWKKQMAENEQPVAWNAAFKQRSTKSPPPSKISKPAIDVVFGQPLAKAAVNSRLEKDRSHAVKARFWLPAIVVCCTEYVEKYGLDEVGIYRISGSASNVNALRAGFAEGSVPDQFLESRQDPHAIASILKAYLRELPDPVLTLDLVPEFNAIVTKITGTPATSSNMTPTTSTISGNIPPELVAAVAPLVSKLPPYNFYLLQTLAQHLTKVSEQSHENKMPISNLGLIFCLTLGLSSVMFRLLVTEHERLFAGGCTSEATFKESYRPDFHLDLGSKPTIDNFGVKEFGSSPGTPIADSLRDDFKDLLTFDNETVHTSPLPARPTPPPRTTPSKPTPPPRPTPVSLHTSTSPTLPNFDFSGSPLLSFDEQATNSSNPFADTNASSNISTQHRSIPPSRTSTAPPRPMSLAVNTSSATNPFSDGSKSQPSSPRRQSSDHQRITSGSSIRERLKLFESK